MTHIIAEPCVDVKDRSCVDVCPVDCIYDTPEEVAAKGEEWETLFIQPEECIDCGLCIDACPVEAIFAEEEVPEKWHGWIAKNYEVFDLEPPEL